MKPNRIIEPQDRLLNHKQRVAFHEAGHAAGIHLNNKARQLPPVFFNIVLNISGRTEPGVMAYQRTGDDCIARLEGGRLIETLAPPIYYSDGELTEHNDAIEQLTKEYNAALETDIINLLIGPFSEARYVADNDDELFNHRLVDLKALGNYGGSSDLALANDYLQSFFADQQQKDEKLYELFIAAFEFVNNDANWAAITKLAEYILASSKNIICCEEIFSMLDHSMGRFQNRRIISRCV